MRGVHGADRGHDHAARRGRPLRVRPHPAPARVVVVPRASATAARAIVGKAERDCFISAVDESRDPGGLGDRRGVGLARRAGLAAVSDVHAFIDASRRSSTASGGQGARSPSRSRSTWRTCSCARAPGTRSCAPPTRRRRSYRWRSCAGAYLSGVGVNARSRRRAAATASSSTSCACGCPESRDRDGGRDAARRDAVRHVHRAGALHLRVHLGVVPSVAGPAARCRPSSVSSRSSTRASRWLIVGVILLLGLLLLRHAIRVARDFWARVRQGFTILRTPRRYLRRVVLPAGARLVLPRRRRSSTSCGRSASTPTLRNALLVLVVGAAGDAAAVHARRRRNASRR